MGQGREAHLPPPVAGVEADWPLLRDREVLGGAGVGNNPPQGAQEAGRQEFVGGGEILFIFFCYFLLSCELDGGPSGIAITWEVNGTQITGKFHC